MWVPVEDPTYDEGFELGWLSLLLVVAHQLCEAKELKSITIIDMEGPNTH